MKTFEQIIGYEEVKAELYRICDSMKNPGKYKKLGVYTPRGLLLSGDPGIGKTTMAKAVIAESGRKVFTLRKDKPNGEFVNRIRTTFENARKEAPSIVLLDDLDKFANEDADHPNCEEYVTVQACIDDSRDSEVFVLATVNSKYDLPESLLRAGRFDKWIPMKPPSREDAVKIIDKYLQEKKCPDDIEAKDVARLLDGRTCADLEMVINEAGIYAAYAGKERIEYDDIVKASLRVIFDAPESTDYSSEANLRKIAVHEAGHAVLAEIFDPGSVNLVSICRHSGETGGLVSVCEAEEFRFSKELQEQKVIGLLGGKAATEIIFGRADCGCIADLQAAFNHVAKFVDYYCDYGFGAFQNFCRSQYVYENKDRLVEQEMNRYYQEAKRMLIENREMLDVFTDALLERKTLTWKEIKKLKDHMKVA